MNTVRGVRWYVCLFVVAMWVKPVFLFAGQALPFVVVLDRKPVAVVIVEQSGEAPLRKQDRRSAGWDDRRAAEVLVDWVRKISDAELRIADSAPQDGPAIYIGAAAIKAGLRLDDIDSPTAEGFRIQCDGRRLLIAGQSSVATIHAVCRLLELWGCRYFVDHPLGEVYPRQKTLSVDQIDLAEKPGFLYRSIWGSQWGGQTLWKIWNGAGGLPLQTGHSWGKYVPQSIFQDHPEYFALRGGTRRPGDWYCTSQPGLRALFAERVIAAIREGNTHPSISPPDGRGYCECEACRSQDDPRVIEPSSGRASVSPRYVDFFQEIARRVGKECPESILSFYCYADYTQAPLDAGRLEPNLCPWLAPIRYCRFHRIGAENCPSRRQLAELVDAWGSIAYHLGYRTYNYNLAECLVPFSMISVWKHDIPFLKARNCLGINLESLPSWTIYGPHLYLSIRLAYNPDADADAIMNDYFERFYGPKAAPFMQEYWLAIDKAFSNLNCHTGSFYAIHLVYTPEFLAYLQGLIERARESVAKDSPYAARVELAAEGLQNAVQYEQLRQAMNRGAFEQAVSVYDSLVKRLNEKIATGLVSQYSLTYLERFLGPQIKAAAAATSAPNRLLAVLPDTWRMTWDEHNEGTDKGYQKPDYDDSSWQAVATYSRPLDAQGLPDRLTIMWYRTKFTIPPDSERVSLLFIEIDGDATVFVNGREVGQSPKRRQPFEVDISSAARPGENTVAVRVDHSVLTELCLGGILRPVLLVGRGE